MRCPRTSGDFSHGSPWQLAKIFSRSVGMILQNMNIEEFMIESTIYQTKNFTYIVDEYS